MDGHLNGLTNFKEHIYLVALPSVTLPYLCYLTLLYCLHHAMCRLNMYRYGWPFHQHSVVSCLLKFPSWFSTGILLVLLVNVNYKFLKCHLKLSTGHQLLREHCLESRVVQRAIKWRSKSVATETRERKQRTMVNDCLVDWCLEHHYSGTTEVVGFYYY